MSGSRFYQQPLGETDISDIGHLLTISGVVFGGGDKIVVYLLPEVDFHGVMKEGIEFHYANTQEWADLLAASDDPKFYGPDKAWHRKVRYIVSGEVQQKVWARDDFTCQFCGRKMGDVQLTVDHWIPLELGGANDTTNYISACRRCNKRKADKHPKEFCREIGLSEADYIVLEQIATGLLRKIAS